MQKKKGEKRNRVLVIRGPPSGRLLVTPRLVIAGFVIPDEPAGFWLLFFLLLL
jgi:hypothetical protein